MITTELMGGLGNQLFQIFNLISYSMDINNIFVLEKKPKLYGPIRNYDVYWNNLFKNILNHCKETQFNFPVWRENGFHHTPIPHYTNPHIRLCGYFQSSKYFDHNKKKILDLLKLDEIKKKIKDENQYDYKKTISMHFRIGDYVKLQEHHPLMTANYYIKSLKKIIEKTNIDTWNILYFYEKDDEEYINKQIETIKNEFENMNFISCNHSLQDWEQMIQMTLCQHNIIANSTFSWWGAYLNENKPIVCIPSKWFGDAKKDLKTDDIYVKEWEKIEQ